MTFTCIVLPDRERLERSWESNAEKVTSDVLKKLFPRILLSTFSDVTERDKHMNDSANELERVLRDLYTIKLEKVLRIDKIIRFQFILLFRISIVSTV